jgi:hypothetical protein
MLQIPVRPHVFCSYSEICSKVQDGCWLNFQPKMFHSHFFNSMPFGGSYPYDWLSNPRFFL